MLNEKSDENPKLVELVENLREVLDYNFERVDPEKKQDSLKFIFNNEELEIEICGVSGNIAIEAVSSNYETIDTMLGKIEGFLDSKELTYSSTRRRDSACHEGDKKTKINVRIFLKEEDKMRLYLSI